MLIYAKVDRLYLHFGDKSSDWEKYTQQLSDAVQSPLFMSQMWVTFYDMIVYGVA